MPLMARTMQQQKESQSKKRYLFDVTPQSRTTQCQ
jgi:hypothetical protein